MRPGHCASSKQVAAYEQPLVEPQVSHFRQVPFRTIVKLPQSEQLSPVSLDLDFDKAFLSERVGAYERLLLDAIAGRLNLFVRSDEQEQAWRWVEPILEAWRNDATGPRPYAVGTWGPPASSALIARDGFAWAEEE